MIRHVLIEIGAGILLYLGLFLVLGLPVWPILLLMLAVPGK